MEITNENFEELYPEMAKKIEECSFCSIDCELSGVTQYKDLNSFDTPKNRYDRMKKKENNYLIMQFGLCIFKYKPDQNTYETTAYNCFLFPRSQNCRYSRDSDFTCLNSSIEFLCSQNFDFNKTFKQGVSFISKDNEEIIRQKVKQTMENREKPKTTLYPSNNPDIKSQIDNMMNEIDLFYENENESKKEIKFSDYLLRIFVEKNIKQKYFNKLKYENKIIENKERLMTITKLNNDNTVNDMELFEKELGFSKIIWLLSKSQKLIVGHNMLTDVMQTIRQFFCQQLPENFDDFKSMTKSIFPKLLDTKYMASVAPLKEIISNTALGDMDKILSKDPFPTVTLENCEYSVLNEKLHEAGYDAFLTGFCYVRMLHYLEKFNSSKKAIEEFYSNKIYLMKSYDLCYIDLDSNQEEPKRDNVFYMEFPSTWQNQDIFDLFSTYGSVHIGWINDTSAFVAIQNLDNVKKAAGQLVGVSGRDYKVYFYSTYIKQLKSKLDGKLPNNGSAQRPAINNAPSEETSTNGANNNNEKRKRNEKNGQTNSVSNEEKTESVKADNKSEAEPMDMSQEPTKKLKTTEKSVAENDKPFVQSQDWS